MIDVSIVIVCMNNLKNLYPCLNSIKKYTSVKYETFVVAYLFSKDNLDKVRKDFPWIKIIESNEIRGFSENNNLALCQAKGKYCFVVNDDTEIKMPTIDILIQSIEKLPNNVSIISPLILNGEGKIAVCGRNNITWLDFIIGSWFKSYHNRRTDYINQKGIFQTYNILGAAFLIKTDVFKSIGWFEEYYFFCPEDIDISRKINRLGQHCYVDTNTEIYHYEGMSGKSNSYIQTATKPAGHIGSLYFYSENIALRKSLLYLNSLIFLPCRFIFHYIKSLIATKDKKETNKILAIGDFNCFKSIFLNMTPKETFIYFYKRLQQYK